MKGIHRRRSGASSWNTRSSIEARRLGLFLCILELSRLLQEDRQIEEQGKHPSLRRVAPPRIRPPGLRVRPAGPDWRAMNGNRSRLPRRSKPKHRTATSPNAR